MSRKSSIDPVLKIELVEKNLRNEIGLREAGMLAALNTERIKRNLHLMTPVEYHEHYYLVA